jgi:hypothetical protein
MGPRFDKSGGLKFLAGLVLGSGITYAAGTETAAAYWHGLGGVRWQVWAFMAPLWIAGGLAGWRAGRRLWPARAAVQH